MGVNDKVLWCEWQRNLYVNCGQPGRAVERRELVCVRVEHHGRIVRCNRGPVRKRTIKHAKGGWRRESSGRG